MNTSRKQIGDSIFVQIRNIIFISDKMFGRFSGNDGLSIFYRQVARKESIDPRQKQMQDLAL
jgi:hypothetical protein